MKSCEEHEKGLMRTRSSRPQPRILQLKATQKMGAYMPMPAAKHEQTDVFR